MKAVLFLFLVSIPSVAGAAEHKKAVPNPWTSRLDWIINIASTSIGSFVDVSTAGIANGDCLVWSSSNNRFEPGSCSGGGAADEFVLLEDGDFMLLEDGDQVILE